MMEEEGSAGGAPRVDGEAALRCAATADGRTRALPPRSIRRSVGYIGKSINSLETYYTSADV